MGLPRPADKNEVRQVETRLLGLIEQLIARADSNDVIDASQQSVIEGTLQALTALDGSLLSLTNDVDALAVEFNDHSDRHITGGADVIPDATTTSSGLLPALSGNATDVLKGNGTWGTVSGGVTDHGALTGLGDDDHTQYVLADGTRTGWPLPAETPTADSIVLSGADARTQPGYGKDFTATDLYQDSTGNGYEATYVAGCINGVALTAASSTAGRTEFIPFISPRRGGTLVRVYIQITGGSPTGDMTIAVYDSKSDGDGVLVQDDLRPDGAALGSETLPLSAPGVYTFTLNADLEPCRVYWLACYTENSVTIRQLPVGGAQSWLGFPVPTGATLPRATVALYESAAPTSYDGTEAWSRSTGSITACFMDFGP